MKIINLIEDFCVSDGFLKEHGLAFYIETPNHKILCDTGASDAFIENAQKKGIRLEEIDTVFISHGHYDHTGGLITFLSLNSRARVFIHKNAIGAFYSLKSGENKYIGMDERIFALDRITWLDGNVVIDGELSIFSGVTERKYFPCGNQRLKKLIDGKLEQDDFSHEQYLVVQAEDKKVLLSGCAHNGIVNIMNEYRKIYGGDPTHVISGFHTSKPEYTAEDDELFKQIAINLLKTNSLYYTGHCTCAHSFEIMKAILGDKLIRFHSGENIF